MDAADLRVFEAVARLGRMNSAALELNTVQSNVTTRIRRLEAELGTPLFDRHSRGVTLTAAGQRLLPYAVRVGRLIEDARRAAMEDGRPKGALTIGSLETTVAIRLAPVLTEYAATYPEVDLVLRTGTTRELIEAVLQHRLEGAFVCGPVDHPELMGEIIFREDLAIASGPDMRSLDDLATRAELKLIVLRAGCSYRQRLEEILAHRGVVGLRQLEFGTVEAIIGCVGAGLGITLLPRGMVEPDRRAGRITVHDLPPAEAGVDTLFIRHRDGLASSALEAFLDCARPSLADKVAVL